MIRSLDHQRISELEFRMPGNREPAVLTSLAKSGFLAPTNFRSSSPRFPADVVRIVGQVTFARLHHTIKCIRSLSINDRSNHLLTALRFQKLKCLPVESAQHRTNRSYWPLPFVVSLSNHYQWEILRQAQDERVVLAISVRGELVEPPLIGNPSTSSARTGGDSHFRSW